MRFTRWSVLSLAAWTLSGGAIAFAESKAGGADSSAQAKTLVQPQVAYTITISSNGYNIGTATERSIFGSVTLSCPERAAAAVVGRDAQNKVIFTNLTRTAPAEDLALAPYSHAFSEIRRIAWSICAPDQSVKSSEKRNVEKKGAFALGGYSFPDEITIQDQLGIIGCEAEAGDRQGKAIPCKTKAWPQPFVISLMRKI